MSHHWQWECDRSNCAVRSVDFHSRIPGMLECECGETWTVTGAEVLAILAEARDQHDPDPVSEASALKHLEWMRYRQAFVDAGKRPPKLDMEKGSVDWTWAHRPPSPP